MTIMGNAVVDKKLLENQKLAEDLQPEKQESELNRRRCEHFLPQTPLKSLENEEIMVGEVPEKQESESQGYADTQLKLHLTPTPIEHPDLGKEDASENNLQRQEVTGRRQGCENESLPQLNQMTTESYRNCEIERLSAEDRNCNHNEENEPYLLSRMRISDNDVFLFHHQPKEFNPNHIHTTDESSETETSDEESLVPEFSTESYSVYSPVGVASISSCSSHFSGNRISHPFESQIDNSSEYTYGFPYIFSSSSYDRGFPYVLSFSSNHNAASRPALGNLKDLAAGAESDGSCNYPLVIEENMPASLDLKSALIACARALSYADMEAAKCLMDDLGKRVSILGKPIQRVGAYTLEGLRARLEFSGSKIYKNLKNIARTRSNLLSIVCPYLKFAYLTANTVSWEAVHNEPIIHIVDFQIADGSQWIPLISVLANRLGGPPVIRITAVNDSQAAGASCRLDNVGKKLSRVAELCNVLLEFDICTISLSDVVKESFRIQPREAVVVNFSYVLHSIPDDSVNSFNYRDRLLRLVKSFSPKIVILTEQEANTNLTSFFSRFIETLDYYTAVFESISAGSFEDEKQRIYAEQHLVAPDIINIIACEGAERVERHEPFKQWRSQFLVAGFTQCSLSPSVTDTVKELLKKFDSNYGLEEKDGALYLHWTERTMATCSAWQ